VSRSAAASNASRVAGSAPAVRIASDSVLGSATSTRPPKATGRLHIDVVVANPIADDCLRSAHVVDDCGIQRRELHDDGIGVARQLYQGGVGARLSLDHVATGRREYGSLRVDVGKRGSDDDDGRHGLYSILNIGVQRLEAAMGSSESLRVVRLAADDLDVAR